MQISWDKLGGREGGWGRKEAIAKGDLSTVGDWVLLNMNSLYDSPRVTQYTTHQHTVGLSVVGARPKAEFMVWDGTAQYLQEQTKNFMAKKREPDGDLASWE